MSLYAEWLEKAYNKDGSANKKIWDVYLPQEQRIYQYIIGEKVENISGTITELSTRFTMSEQYICGFVDGINEVLPEPYDMETLDTNSQISLDIDLEKLYRKMVDYKAEHLYTLPEWKTVFSEEKLDSIFWEERKSAVYKRPSPKVGRNDPCPCGSGKKYKKCCVSN